MANSSFRLPGQHNNAWHMHIGSSDIKGIYVGSKLVWPNCYAEPVSSSLDFVSSYNRIKDYTFTSKDLLSGLEIDPAGGTLSVRITSREDSNWHRCSAYFKSTNIAPLSFVSYTYQNKVTDISFGNAFAPTNTSSTYTYSIDTNLPETSTSKVWYAYINNTSLEYCNPGTSYDYKMVLAVPPNSTSSKRVSYLYLYNIKDTFNYDVKYSDTTPVAWVWQDPNIMHYIHVAWASSPSVSDIISTNTSINMQVNSTSKTIYLFVEIGISIDGGNTIYWNHPADSSTANQSSVFADIAPEFINKLSISSSNSAFGIFIGSTLSNSNFIPITINTVTSQSKSGKLLSSSLSNISGNQNSPAGYVVNSQSISKTSSMYYGEDISFRSTTISVSGYYPDYEF